MQVSYILKSKFQIFIENFLISIKSIIKVLTLSKKNQFPKNKTIKEECVILGNGPSLNETVNNHSRFMSDKTLICVNHFASSELYEKLKPEIYVIIAPELWLDNVEDIYKQKGKVLFRDISTKTKWPIMLFISIGAKKYEHKFEEFKKNKNISIFYINTTGVEGFKNLIFYLYKKRLGMPRPHNVLIPSLMLSIYFRFKKIYLTGTDHDWLKYIIVGQDNKVYLTQKHFYDEKTATPQPMLLVGKGERRLHEILDKFRISLKGYFIIREFAEQNNCQIINLTPNSFIDAFEKKILVNGQIN
ncbi:MAG: DUF115 domain-containing protein [Bacteroidales bacterium]|nr:DUF115 domain-containing protein [Bacteroidales bacterium]